MPQRGRAGSSIREEDDRGGDGTGEEKVPRGGMQCLSRTRVRSRTVSTSCTRAGSQLQRMQRRSSRCSRKQPGESKVAEALKDTGEVHYDAIDRAIEAENVFIREYEGIVMRHFGITPEIFEKPPPTIDQGSTGGDDAHLLRSTKG